MNMVDVILTALIPVTLLATVLWQCKRDDNVTFSFGKDYTVTLKGICAIVVILVHFDSAHQNPLQDAMGSFAFVAVTIFFMISAYGMQLSAERKPEYLTHFWRNRLVSLLIPCAFVNILEFGLDAVSKDSMVWNLLWRINGYVMVLLEYCLLFYVVMIVKKWLKIEKTWITDLMIIFGVTISSLLLYLYCYPEIDAPPAWCFERMGLVWGLLLYRHFNPIATWLRERNVTKSLIFLVFSLITGVAYLKFKEVWFYGQYLLKILLGVVIITFTLLMSQKKMIGNPLSRFLGDISFEIYLSHTVVMAMLEWLCPNLASGAFILSTISITIAVSFLMHVVAKPIINTLRV